MADARGIKNCNPGNIRKSKDKWQGLAERQADPAFFVFTAPVWGIRAIARILINYQDDHDLDTPKKIVDRWAPSTENNSAAYCDDVCRRSGWKPDSKIDMQSYADCRKMVEAIIHHENGKQPYSEMEIDEGLRLAGVVKPVPASTAVSTAKDPKVIAASIVGGATVAQQVIGSVSGVWDSINAFGFDPRILMGAGGLAVAIVAAWLVIDYIKRRRSGLA